MPVDLPLSHLELSIELGVKVLVYATKQLHSYIFVMALRHIDTVTQKSGPRALTCLMCLIELFIADVYDFCPFVVRSRPSFVEPYASFTCAWFFMSPR